MKEKTFNSQRGFSLPEVIIILVIIAIVSTIALTQFGRTSQRFDRQNIARELKVYLERARFDSVKRRAVNPADQARVVITSATAFNVTTDINYNGTIDSKDTRFMSLNGRSDAKIVGNNLIFPITISFNQRGQATATYKNASNNEVEITPSFTICDANCTYSTANMNNASVIMVTPTGTVTMLNGGETMSVINAPNVTTLGGSNGVSNYVYVNSN